jgi:site-specific DNA-methyltransferase (adenine-specific)
MLTITNEDCMDLMKRCKDNEFDLAICDPPFGSAKGGHHAQGGGRFTKYGEGAKPWDTAPGQEYFDELFRVSKPGGRIIWGGNYFDLPPSRNFIVWRKLNVSETFNMAMCEYAWTDIKGTAKCFECIPQDKRRFHPTQKPVKLYSWLLARYARPGVKILDTHMGSGSIAIACHNAGLNLTACEINPEYYGAAMRRIDEHIKQLELFQAQKYQRALVEQELFDDA